MACIPMLRRATFTWIGNLGAPECEDGVHAYTPETLNCFIEDDVHEDSQRRASECEEGVHSHAAEGDVRGDSKL